MKDSSNEEVSYGSKLLTIKDVGAMLKASATTDNEFTLWLVDGYENYGDNFSGTDSDVSFFVVTDEDVFDLDKFLPMVRPAYAAIRSRAPEDQATSHQLDVIRSVIRISDEEDLKWATRRPCLEEMLAFASDMRGLPVRVATGRPEYPKFGDAQRPETILDAERVRIVSLDELRDHFDFIHTGVREDDNGDLVVDNSPRAAKFSGSVWRISVREHETAGGRNVTFFAITDSARVSPPAEILYRVMADELKWPVSAIAGVNSVKIVVARDQLSEVKATNHTVSLPSFLPRFIDARNAIRSAADFLKVA